MTKWMVWTVAALLPAVVAAQPLRLGFVDLQRALNESEAGARAKESFKKEVDRLQAELRKQKEELEALKSELEKKATVMKEEELRNLEKEYQRKLRDFERAYKDSQAELQAKDSELTADILQELQEVIAEFGQQEGYTFIFERSGSGLLYAAPEADLTDQVIERYDAWKKKHNKK